MKKAFLTGAILASLFGFTVADMDSKFKKQSNHAHKHLVFMAGPRRSDSTAVDRFFQTHAVKSGISNGLEGWVWPNITTVLPGKPYQYFEHFFWNAKNATMQNILMDGIQDAWDNAQYGIILGAEGFENTRGDPHSAALQVMHKIVNALQVTPNHVHVVLTYQTPRMNQWISLFEHNQVGDGSYKEFVCDSSYTDNLATISMNPFMLANVFLKQGWKVAAIDALGVNDAGLDLAHAVACNVLPKVQCVNETIVGLKDEYIIQEVTATMDWQSFHALETDQIYELESLFQTRDCYYRSTIQEADANFSVVHMSEVWEECNGEMTDFDPEAFLTLTHDASFLELIKAQAGCSTVRQHVSQPTATVLNSREKTLVGGVIFMSMFVMYQVIARYKRRQTHTIKSPRFGDDVWSDFANENTTNRVENLRGVSSEDESFSEVDLQSPCFNRSSVRPGSSSSSSSSLPETSSSSSMTEMAKEGRSVRTMYRVGLYQNSPSSKHKPQRGDSDFEFKIKSLEREFA